MTHNHLFVGVRAREAEARERDETALPRQLFAPCRRQILICLAPPPIVAWSSPIICSHQIHPTKSLQDNHLRWLPCHLETYINHNFSSFTKHHRSSLALLNQLHSSPTSPFRYSLTGTSESKACFTHPKRFSLHSNHSLTRPPVVRHGLS